MAGKIKAIIAAQFEDSGLKKAQKGFSSLGKTLKTALGAVGLGIGVSALVGQLQAAGKAAAADAKSQGLLANALRNTVSATDAQIASVEVSISKMEGLSAVADDNIRPAFAQLARVTGDVGKATELTSLALDVAAGTGRDLGAVTIALGKAYQGNTASLAKLGINVKGVKDPMAALAKQFAGAAEAAANLDPYQRLQIVFGNLQEDIGVALLPYLNELADYFNSPTGQKALQEFAGNVAEIATSMIDLAASIADTGVIDLLSEFFSIAAKVAKLDFGGINTQLNNNVMTGWVDKYINNRAQFDKDMEVLKENEADYYKRIQKFVDAYLKNIQNNQGQFGSIRAIEDASNKAAKAASGSGIGGGTGLADAQKSVSAAAKAAADAIKAATKAANDQAEAYLKAAESAAELMAKTRSMVAEFTQLFKITPELGAFEQVAVDAFTNIFDAIDSALADGQILSDAASRLREYAASERSTLASIAKNRDVLAGKIDVARSITSGVMGLVGITNLLETTSKSVTQTVSTIINGIQVATTKTFDVVESGGLIDNFQKLVDKTKAFAKNLVDLKKLGLNKQLFAQLVNAGADAGGATAEALVAGGADTIQALNSLYNELALSAGDIAANATDTLYEVGQQVVSNGFIEGLLSQDSELQRAAQTLADAFASTFQTQLQLAVDAVLPNQGGLIDQVAAVNMGGGGPGLNGRGNLKAASLGGATIFNVNVSAGVVTDPNGLARTVIDSVKKYERSNGSVWVAA
jgi:hypothetical protein